MTTFGKILVVINLIFSLITGGLIVMVYSVQTNWKASFDRLEKNYRVSEANVKAYAEEANEIKKKGDAAVVEVKKQLDVATKERDAAQKRFDDKVAELKVQLEKANSANVNVDAATAELARRRDEVKNLQAIIAGRDQRLLELEAKAKQNQDNYVRADIAARSAHDRNKQLMEQVETLATQLEKTKIGGIGATGFAERKPAEDVKGIVTEANSKDNLYTISLGSDNGITKGDTLEVYRLQPEPKYLGKIRILDVNHHEAVGRPLNTQRTAQIQKGDTVASNVSVQR